MVKLEKIIIKYDDDSYLEPDFYGKVKVSPGSARVYINRMDGTLIDLDYTDENGEVIALASGLSKVRRYNDGAGYFVSMNHATPGSEANWGHVSKAERMKAFDACDFAKYGIEPQENDGSSFAYWLDLYYTCADYERYNAFLEGEWHMMVIDASAVISYDSELGRQFKTVHGPSLGGIESDIDKAGRINMESEILSELASQLAENNMPHDFTDIEIEVK